MQSRRQSPLKMECFSRENAARLARPTKKKMFKILMCRFTLDGSFRNKMIDERVVVTWTVLWLGKGVTNRFIDFISIYKLILKIMQAVIILMSKVWCLWRQIILCNYSAWENKKYLIMNNKFVLQQQIFIRFNFTFRVENH